MPQKEIPRFFSYFFIGCFAFLFLFTFYAIYLKTELTYDTFFHIEIGRYMIENQQIVRTAIHTYVADHLPYVSHELGFQYVVALLYNWWGWRGVHLFSVFSLILLLWGTYRLVDYSRVESGIKVENSFLYFLVPLFIFLIAAFYFQIRPQMLSIGLIVWYVVWLIEFRLHRKCITLFKLFVMSIILANIHGGVWPVIVVFTLMSLAADILQRKISILHVLLLVGMIGGGFLNLGGIEAISYFLTLNKSELTSWVSEWAPVSFRLSQPTGLLFFTDIVLLFLCFLHPNNKNYFRVFLAIGVLYLGLANYKQHLFLIAFLPYFVAVAIDQWKVSQIINEELKKHYSRKIGIVLVSFGIILYFIFGLISGYKVNPKEYPVQEMEYILSKHNKDTRPKILAPYADSGYVMYAGGDVLADGRFDPFILPQTKSIHDWNAFERVSYAFSSLSLGTIIKSDHPEYLIIPKIVKKGSYTPNQLYVMELKESLGNPTFTGSFGEVFDLRKQ